MKSKVLAAATAALLLCGCAATPGGSFTKLLAAATAALLLSGCAATPGGSFKFGYGLISVEATWTPTVKPVVVVVPSP